MSIKEFHISKVFKTLKVLYTCGNISHIDKLCKVCCLQMYYLNILQMYYISVCEYKYNSWYTCMVNYWIAVYSEVSKIWFD